MKNSFSPKLIEEYSLKTLKSSISVYFLSIYKKKIIKYESTLRNLPIIGQA